MSTPASPIAGPSSSPISSPPTRGGTLSSIAEKVGRALSPNRNAGRDGPGFDRRDSFGRIMSNIPDERGRDRVVSTGRGGAGNLIRSPSRGVDPEVVPGSERGREPAVRDSSTDGRVTHSGRGGAGNIRSPSRDPRIRIDEEREEALQDQLVAEARGRPDAKFSTGRGGAGNIRDNSQSRSRSAVREREPEKVQSPTSPHLGHTGRGGRGGWGNVSHGDEKSVDQSMLDKEAGIAAKYKHDDAAKPHFHGKGGAGNFNQPHEHVDLSTLSLEEREAHAKLNGHKPAFVSGGRGGAGNIHHSSPDDSRGRDQHKGQDGMLKNVFRSLSRSVQSREHRGDRKETAAA